MTEDDPSTADYLIMGAGAVGMAFADSLLTHSTASMVIVDRHHRPGGHWNDAYPFVRLHQPASFYGVSSRELGSGVTDEVGLNKGFHELASGQEVLSHFDLVMQQRFLASGRVHADAQRWSDAYKAYTEATEILPKYFLVWLERGRLNAKLGRWNAAASDFSQAVEIGCSAQRAELLGVPQLLYYAGQSKAYERVKREIENAGAKPKQIKVHVRLQSANS